MSIQAVFLSLIGIMLFTAGINTLQTAFASKKKGGLIKGETASCTLRETKDEKGRLIQHYYSLNINYKENGKAKSAGIRSTREFHPGDPVLLNVHDNEVFLYEKGTSPFSGLFLMLSGVLLIAAEMLYSYKSATAASYMLSAVFASIAVAVFISWYRDHNEKLEKHTGTVEALLYYEQEKNQRRIFRTVEKYPLIVCTHGDQTYRYLSKNIAHSSTKEGSEVSFYTSPDGTVLIENRTSAGMLVLAIAMAAISILGLLSTLMA